MLSNVIPQKKKILFLSSWLPFPPNNGSKLRIYNLLCGLSKSYDIVLIYLNANSSIEKPSVELQSICQEIYAISAKPFNPRSMKARLGFLSLVPRSIVDTFSHEIASKIREIVAEKKPDLAIASQLGTAIYYDSFNGLPAVFEEVEIGLFYERFRYAPSLPEKYRNGLTWWKHRHYLKKLINYYQKCTVVSEKEKNLLVKMGCKDTDIEVIDNCIDITAYREINEKPQPDTLIFTGSFSYYPNYEAVVWFLEDIYPRIKLRIPSLKLIITGDPANRQLPVAKDVYQTGYVEDIRPWIASAWISVVPILSGGGTRLKILEAMGLHTPVVTTYKGAEGLEIEHNSNILIADNPVEFSECIIKLLTDPYLRQSLADQAYQLVQKKYEWSVVLPRFCYLIEMMVKEHYRGL
jgi:polysaccharide biosynthesis protein PslH